MPELPEVETVRRGLAPVLEGQTIDRIEARRPDLRFALPERFAERLTGAVVLRLERRAKYLLAVLDTGEVWLSHLGMSGRFRIEGVETAHFVQGPRAGTGETDMPHDHVVLRTGQGTRITYHDPRRFGFMDLIAEADLSGCRWLAGLGPEPLGNGFHADALGEALAGRRTSMKAALLDQRVVAGLGNIYVCEALFRAGIAPDRACETLTRPEIEALCGAIRAVLADAIEAGGSSLRDFSHTDGGLGYFQHRFDVYDRARAPCTRCGGVIERSVQSGRSSFFCPDCQH